MTSPKSSNSESPERRLLREALVAIEEIHTDACSAWCGYRELRESIRALLAQPEGQNKSKAPSSGSLPNTSGPVPAAPSEKPQPSATPRTEAAAFRSQYGDHVQTDFARQLERELAEEIARANQHLHSAANAQREVVALTKAAQSATRRSIIDECIQAVSGEYLNDATKEPDDEAYQAAVAHCVGALRVLQEKTCGISAPDNCNKDEA